MDLSNELRNWLRRWLFRPQPPGPIYIFLREVEGMARTFAVDAGLPPLATDEVGEVLQRKFVRVINAGDPVAEVVPADQAMISFSAMQDDQVHVELWNIDDAGNESLTPSARDFVVLDTNPPNAPGDISITLREVPDVPPV